MNEKIHDPSWTTTVSPPDINYRVHDLPLHSDGEIVFHGCPPNCSESIRKEVKALQDELAAARNRITELEACLDDANGHCAWAEEDGKKWKAWFEWLAKTTCAAVTCGKFLYCSPECTGLYIMDNVVNKIAAFADKEIGK